MSNLKQLKEILSKLDEDELEELLDIVKENKDNEDKDIVISSSILKNRSNRKTRFSMDEIDFLSEYYPKHGTQWCVDHLGRTPASIKKKVEELGLHFRPENPDIFHPTKIYASPMDTKTPRQNLFLQHKPTKKEAKELVKDAMIDQLLNKDLVPTSRGNRPSNMITITCYICGEKDRVNRKIVGDMERFKCNRCMIKGK